VGETAIETRIAEPVEPVSVTYVSRETTVQPSSSTTVGTSKLSWATP
jgi:hypothetical protein